jgi:hypothetical protein
LEKILQQAEAYELGVKDWEAARAKAQAALDLYPNFPDPQDLFVALGLQARPRRLPALDELARQLLAGALLGLPAAALLLYLGFRWITRP